MKVLLVVFCFLVSFGSFSSENEQFYQIQSTKLYEIVENDNGQEREVLVGTAKAGNHFSKLMNSNNVEKTDIQGAIMMTKKIIALGKELYKIVEAGRPVVNASTEAVEVLPHNDGVAIPAIGLSGWKAPKMRKYLLKTENYLGMNPVVFEFMLIFTYGGSDQGKGKFITGAEIKPTKVSVKWGYEFNAQFKVQTIINEGTEEDPIAGLVMMVDSKINTVLQEEQMNKTFYVNGLGHIKAY